jgi:hypothetical protein
MELLNMILLIYIPVWYNETGVVKEDDSIEATSRIEATSKAYNKYSGKPPASYLRLKFVGVAKLK